MRKREVVSYIISCIAITAVVLLLLMIGYKDKTILTQAAEIDNLEEIKLTDDFQGGVDLLTDDDMIENKEGDLVTKDDYILDLELILVAKTMTLGNAYDAISALDFYLGKLQQILDVNDIIYPEFIYEEIPNQHPLANLMNELFHHKEESLGTDR